MTASASTPPLTNQPARTSGGAPRLRLLLVLMCTSLGLVVGATSSLSVAQPDIGRALGASQTQLTWVINGYALAFAALLLPAGIATDKYGRRRALTLGLLVFGTAGLLSAFAGSPATLITLRIVAGLGATLVMPATLSVLVDSYPPQRRAFAVSVWAAVTGAGALVGVFLSGLLLHWFWWGSVQLVYGVAALLLVVPVAAVVNDRPRPELSLDLAGSLTSSLGLAGLVYAVIQGPDQGWFDALTLAGFAAAAVGLGAFVAVELRGRDPLLDLRLFRSPGLAAGSLLVTLLSLAVFGFFLLGPQFLQDVKGHDTLGAALRLLPFALGIGPASQLSPELTARFGPRVTGAGGAAIMALGLALFAVTARGPYWQFAVAIVVTAAGMGIALTAGTTLIIDGLPAERRTLASAVNDVTREVGGAIGAAVLGSLLVTLYGRHVRPALDGLPPAAASAAKKSITAAAQTAGQSGLRGERLLTTAQDAFTRGYQGAMLLGAAVLLATAVVVAMLAPSAATQRDHNADASPEQPENSDTVATGRAQA